jgi:hypothetical protein
MNDRPKTYADFGIHPPPPPPEWWLVHENLATLAQWMADIGNSAHDVAAMVEKPWHYEEEWKEMQTNLAAQDEPLDLPNRPLTLVETEAMFQAVDEAKER